MNEPSRVSIPLRLYAVITVAVLLGVAGGTFGGYFAGRSGVAAGTPTTVAAPSPTPEARQIAVDTSLPAEAPGIAAIAEKALPGVVTIVAIEASELPSQGGTPTGPVSSGSGFVFDPSGWILTNNHVVGDRTNVRVMFSDGSTRTAAVVGRDPYMDTALLKIDGGPFPALELGDSDALKAGDTVIAVGSPLRSFTGTVTAGIVSGLRRSFPNRVTTDQGEIQIDMIDMIQVDAALNAGNSGGPLLGRDGKVIGINTGREEGAEGIGFALPISAVERFLDILKAGGAVEHGYMGVRYSMVNEDVKALRNITADRGAYIVEIVADSTAKAAGLREGDIILAVNGRDISGLFTLAEAIFELPVGANVTFLVDRSGERLDLETPLLPRPAPK